MASRPNLHVMTGGQAVIDLRTLRAKQHRVARALLKAQRAVEAALREYQGASTLATEERAPVNRHTNDRIVESLVSADALIRTEIALRATRSPERPDAEPTLESDPDAVDEES